MAKIKVAKTKVTKVVKVKAKTKASLTIRADYFVVGLGNPGSKYKNTRHNVGFSVIEEILNRYPATDSKILKGQIEIAEIEISGLNLVLGKPHTFMNLSGKALKLFRRKLGVKDLNKLVIIHDEMDLPPGQVKLKQGGGTAGHKGLSSIGDALGSLDFWRIKIGIGKPPSKSAGADYVLQTIKEPEIKSAIISAVDILESFIQPQNN